MCKIMRFSDFRRPAVLLVALRASLEEEGSGREARQGPPPPELHWAAAPEVPGLPQHLCTPHGPHVAAVRRTRWRVPSKGAGRARHALEQGAVNPPHPPVRGRGGGGTPSPSPLDGPPKPLCTRQALQPRCQPPVTALAVAAEAARPGLRLLNAMRRRCGGGAHPDHDAQCRPTQLHHAPEHPILLGLPPPPNVLCPGFRLSQSPTTCQIRYRSHLWDQRSTGRL